MLRTIRRLMLLLVAALLAWAVIAWTDALPRLDAADRAAVAFMEQRAVPPSGGDALPLIYRMSRQVPAEDVAMLAALPVAQLPAQAGSYPARHVAALLERDHVPTLALANGPALRASLQEHAAAAALLPALFAATHLSWPEAVSMPPLGVPEPLPDFQAVARLARQGAALRFVQGDAAGAAADLCASTAAWRRLLASSTALIPTMALAQAASGDARLLAEARARAPEAAVVPCAVLEPPLEPAPLCPALRHEFAALGVYAEAMAGGSAWWEHASIALASHHGHTRALRARALAQWCESPPVVVANSAAVDCGPVDWLFDMMGCAIVPIAAPAYAGYRERLDDSDAVLRLAALADWLRAGASSDARTLAARFEARPAALRADGQRLRIEQGGAWLEFRARAPSYGTRGAPIPVLLPQER